MTITILGSGTSTGIPTLSCQCSTCISDDPRDKRLRSSVHIQNEDTSIVIDTSADFRQQLIRESVNSLDAVLYTHHHFDHIGGFDDLRGFNYSQRRPMPIYLSKITLSHLKKTFSYAFGECSQLGGGIPEIEINIIRPYEPFQIGSLLIEPVALLHGEMEVFGFKVGNFAYCTDTNHIPDETKKKIAGSRLLILDALRPQPHSTHFHLEQSIREAQQLNCEMTYFTHIAHQTKHSEVEKLLPDRIELAYDGMKIEL